MESLRQKEDRSVLSEEQHLKYFWGVRGNRQERRNNEKDFYFLACTGNGTGH
jgi:hypothetical protein